MSEQSPPPPTPEGPLSPDGKYRWDGSEWQAVQAPPPSPEPTAQAPLGTVPPPVPPPVVVKKKGHLARNLGLGLLGLIVLFVIIGLASGGSKGTPTASPSLSASAQAAAAEASADAAVAAAVAADKAAADKAAADAAAADAAAAAAAPKTFSGTGSKVTDHFQLKQGSYKLVWKASGGSDNFKVTAHWIEATRPEELYRLPSDHQGLVNEIPPNPSSGETILDAHITGDYYLEVAASTLSWTITLTPGAG
jgi:hypothetical protein